MSMAAAMNRLTATACAEVERPGRLCVVWLSLAIIILWRTGVLRLTRLESFFLHALRLVASWLPVLRLLTVMRATFGLTLILTAVALIRLH